MGYEFRDDRKQIDADGNSANVPPPPSPRLLIPLSLILYSQRKGTRQITWGKACIKNGDTVCKNR